jgi:hypothetical protein
MYRRDYLVREIEKMRAVLQKIFGLRVDKEEEAQELISNELNCYFEISKAQFLHMSLDEFCLFIQSKNVTLVDFLGSLLYASVNLEKPLSEMDVVTLRKILIAWDVWEAKTKTLDLERLERKKEIIALLEKQNNCHIINTL